jgi:hypothetical protein
MTPRFKLLTLEQVDGLPDIAWLIDGILPEGATGELYGESNVGKTFVALDWALTLASGTDYWMGRAVTGGPVVYLAAEAVRSLKSRVRAWKREHNVTGPLPCHVIGEAVQLLEMSDTKQLLTAIQAVEPRPRLIVLDTKARCTYGANENASEQQSIGIASVDLLRRETGATVLLLHHPNAGGEKDRGWTGWRAAYDVMLQLKSEDGALVLSSPKMRDAAPLEPPVRLALVPASGSLVVAPAELAPRVTLTTTQRRVLEALDRIALSDGVPTSEWESASPVSRSQFFAVRKRLVADGYVSALSRARYGVSPAGLRALGKSPESDSSPVGVRSDYPTSSPKSGGAIAPDYRTTGRTWEPEDAA